MRTLAQLLGLLLIPALFVPSLANEKEGTIVLVGGGEIPPEIKAYVQQFSKDNGNKLLIVTAASSYPAVQEEQISYWQSDDVDISIAHSSKDFSKFSGHRSVWFSGGDQKKLYETFKDTTIKSYLEELYTSGGLIGGTSAGCSYIGEVMPYEESSMYGIGLLKNTVIDQHFQKRNRFNRLQKIVSEKNNFFGIGIDENSGIIIRNSTIKNFGGKAVIIKGEKCQTLSLKIM